MCVVLKNMDEIFDLLWCHAA